MTKSNVGKKGFIWLARPESESTEGKQGRSSDRAGADARLWRGAALWLALHLAHPASL